MTKVCKMRLNVDKCSSSGSASSCMRTRIRKKKKEKINIWLLFLLLFSSQMFCVSEKFSFKQRQYHSQNRMGIRLNISIIVDYTFRDTINDPKQRQTITNRMQSTTTKKNSQMTEQWLFRNLWWWQFVGDSVTTSLHCLSVNTEHLAA